MIVEDGISIPSSYTSWLAPIQCPKLHTEVRATRDKDKHPDVSYNICYVIWKPLLCQQSHCAVLPHSNHNPPLVTSWNNVGPLCNWLGCEDLKMFLMYKPSWSLIQLLLPQKNCLIHCYRVDAILQQSFSPDLTIQDSLVKPSSQFNFIRPICKTKCVIEIFCIDAIAHTCRHALRCLMWSDYTTVRY